jgi:hypothetical protein
LIEASPNHPALMSAYENKYMQPRRLAFIRIFEKAQAQGLLPQNTDVEILGDMITGTMLYYLLFQPDERNEAKVRVYLSRLFQQAGFRIPHKKQKQESKPLSRGRRT